MDVGKVQPGYVPGRSTPHAARGEEVEESGKRAKKEDAASKARSWVEENITGTEGKESNREVDFGTALTVGVAGGAAAGTFLGMAKGVLDTKNAEFVKTEVTKDITEEKLLGYKQKAYPFQGGGYSLKFDPNVRTDVIDHYKVPEYKEPALSNPVTLGLLGAFLGAVSGGVLAVAYKLIRSAIVNK